MEDNIEGMKMQSAPKGAPVGIQEQEFPRMRAEVPSGKHGYVTIGEIDARLGIA